MKNVLVTGAAGFIGANLVKYLLRNEDSVRVVGLDNLNDYYDVNLKLSRLEQIRAISGQSASSGPGGVFEFVKGDITDASLLGRLFDSEKFDVVVNLAAQAGVRYSIENPDAYIQSNIVGFYNILEACRRCGCVKHLVYASSSSVYGGNDKVPFSEQDRVDDPVSLYAATKRADELLCAAYSNLYGIPATGLRFFTVYGPAGRPDMAYFSFADTLSSGGTIRIFNHGNCLRDFTYVDDIVEAVVRVMKKAPEKGHRVYNIGNSAPVNLMDFVRILQEELVGCGVLPRDFDLQSHMQFVPMQKGDVQQTFSDTSALERDFGFRPSTPLRTGLRNFANWYKGYIKK